MNDYNKEGKLDYTIDNNFRRANSFSYFPRKTDKM